MLVKLTRWLDESQINVATIRASYTFRFKCDYTSALEDRGPNVERKVVCLNAIVGTQL